MVNPSKPKPARTTRATAAALSQASTSSPGQAGAAALSPAVSRSGSTVSSPDVAGSVRAPQSRESIVASLGVIPAGEPTESAAVEYVYQAQVLMTNLCDDMYKMAFAADKKVLVRKYVEEFLRLVKDMAVDALRLERANRSLEGGQGSAAVEDEVRGLREEVSRLAADVRAMSSREVVVESPKPVPVPAPRRLAKSYAQAATGPALGVRASGVVIVESKDTDAALSTAQAVKERLIESMDPVKDGFQVVALRKRGNKVELRTATAEGARKIIECKDRLDGAGLTVKELGRRDPRLILYDVPRTLSGPEALKAVCQQNFRGEAAFEGEWAKLVHYAGPRKDEGPKRHIVFSVKPSLRSAILRKAYLAVGWDHCRVDDYIGVSRCGRCLVYGHSAAKCKKQVVCAHCSAEGHQKDQCPSLSKPAVCAACRSLGKDDHNHSVRSGECPVYRLWYRRQVEMTNYDG